MTVELNKRGLTHARRLVKAGKVVRDERDDWSEDALSAKDETTWLERHGWSEYAEWHLGIDTEKSAQTKARFEFPYGDYSQVHRCAVISMESRAAQYGHHDIAKASKRLLALIDRGTADV